MGPIEFIATDRDCDCSFFFFFFSFASLPLSLPPFAFKRARGYFPCACVYVLIDTRNLDPRDVTMRIDGSTIWIHPRFHHGEIVFTSIRTVVGSFFEITNPDIIVWYLYVQ